MLAALGVRRHSLLLLGWKSEQADCVSTRLSQTVQMRLVLKHGCIAVWSSKLFG